MDSSRVAERAHPRAGRAADLNEAFIRYRNTADVELRNQLVHLHLWMSDVHARHYARSGIVLDDLKQVAGEALIKAVERFDPSFDVAFTTFAARTIDGELKRFVRDCGWMIRPPRRISEAYLAVKGSLDDMTQELGRAPTTSELSFRTGYSEEEILEGMEAGSSRFALSLDVPRPTHDAEPADRKVDAIEQVETTIIVDQFLGELDDRDRWIIEQRFLRRRSQPEIAAELGISQSYLSRVISGILSRMRHAAPAI